MCLAIPSKIISIDGATAVVELYGGARKQISTLLLAEEPAPGDFVIVHAGFAIQKIERENAEESYRILNSLISELGADA